MVETKNSEITAENPGYPPKILGAPGRYIQGYGVLGQYLARIITDYGDNPLIVSDRIVWSILEHKVTGALDAGGIKGTFVEFGGECSVDEIERIAKIYRESGCNVVLGLGGGKTIDTAKAMTFELPHPIIIAPTIASNDAPTSRNVVIYSEKGELVKVRQIPHNPEVILVDTQVIAQAPARFLAAGMGDALATKFEAEQSQICGELNLFQGRPLHTAMVLADTCYRLIRQYGVLARMAVEANSVTEPVELVVEANIYLSGLGFESGGLSAAHALTRGFSAIEEMHGSLHGEEVAFGVLVQLVLENRSQEFIEDMMGFYRQVGLPCSLGDLGLMEVTDEHLRTIAERTCYVGSHVYKLTAPIDERTLIDAVRMADALGRNFRR